MAASVPEPDGCRGYAAASRPTSATISRSTWAGFLPKPFTPRELREKVREVLVA